jgi:hypothetical protein
MTHQVEIKFSEQKKKKKMFECLAFLVSKRAAPSDNVAGKGFKREICSHFLLLFINLRLLSNILPHLEAQFR